MRIMAVMLAFLLIGGRLSHAQTYPCGTTITPAQLNYLNQTRVLRQNFDRHSQRILPLYFPIQHHVVRQSNGNGGLSPGDLTDIMDNLNSHFQNANVQFFECAGVNYIDNDYFYDFNENQEDTLCSANDINNVINIYYFNSVTSSSGGSLCGYAYFPNGPDRIVMDNSCSVNGSTIVHEMGHYFALYHTHGKNNCGTTDELADGSNCTDNGDDVCDTPADPNLRDYQTNCGAYLVNSSCAYIGSYTDDNGDPYNPQTTNIMSYSRSSCRTVLTNGQYNRIAFAALYDRAYLSCPACADPANAQSANEGVYTAELKWTSSNPGADYSVEWGPLDFFYNGTDSTGSSSGFSIAGVNTVIATGLLPGNDYEFFVWEDCGSKITSIEPVAFSTLTLVDEFPSCEDFESFSLCGHSCGVSCELRNGWSNATTDDTDWSADENDTPSSNTGPPTDHTDGTTTGNYLYLEASNSCFPSKNALLLSPVYDLSSAVNPSIEFWYHLYGTDMGSLTLEVESPFDSGDWTNLFSVSGNQANTWHHKIVDVSDYSGSAVRFRFTGVTGTDFRSDMALDDICVKENIPSFVTISGFIKTEVDTPVSGVTVILSGDDSDTVLTGSDGFYSFDVPPGGNYTVTPVKNNDSADGINTLDIILIQRHILSIEEFNSPYKIIAAALANAQVDTLLSTLDIIRIRQMILGSITAFPTGRLWDFVTSDFVFINPQKPYQFPRSRTYDNVTINQSNQDFIGIRLGDVNGN